MSPQRPRADRASSARTQAIVLAVAALAAYLFNRAKLLTRPSDLTTER